MPLISSPIDGSPMRQIQRFGIELDICPTSGGVWLDKGELEKLIALMQQAAEETQSFTPPPRDYDDRRHDDEYRKPRYKENDHYSNPRHKKKGALHQMMEIFDF